MNTTFGQLAIGTKFQMVEYTHTYTKLCEMSATRQDGKVCQFMPKQPVWTSPTIDRKIKYVRLGSLCSTHRFYHQEAEFITHGFLGNYTFGDGGRRCVCVKRKDDTQYRLYPEDMEVAIEDDGTCKFEELAIGELFTSDQLPNCKLRRLKPRSLSSRGLFLTEESHSVTDCNLDWVVKRVT